MASKAHFNEAIHAPTRLRLCALLRPVDFAEFSTLTATLNISEANLSKTIRKLVDLKYVTTKKRSSPEKGDSRRRTHVSLTSLGRQAFDQHVAALREIATAASPSEQTILPAQNVPATSS